MLSTPDATQHRLLYLYKPEIGHSIKYQQSLIPKNLRSASKVPHQLSPILLFFHSSSFSLLLSPCLFSSPSLPLSHYFSPSFSLILFLICLPVSSSTHGNCHYMLWRIGSLHAYEPLSSSLSLSCFPGSHTLRWRDNTSSR